MVEAGSKLRKLRPWCGNPSLTWPHVLQCEVLIWKAASVDGLPPCAIVVGEVASLQAQSTFLVGATQGWQEGAAAGVPQSTQGPPCQKPFKQSDQKTSSNI